MIPDIKHYIFNLIPLKLVLLEPTVVSVAIDHQMAMIQIQVGKNCIEDILLDGGYRVNIISGKLKV
jgi:hypothetical protein